MKIIVVTDQGGKVVGTAHDIRSGNPASGDGGPVAAPGQSVRVIDMPSELEDVMDAEELHRKLEPHVRSR
jgi:hypothetical protein